MPTRDRWMFLLGLRLHLMRNQSIWVPGGVWLQGSNLKELTEGHHQEWSLRINLTELFLDSMGGGAWPFLVGGMICLIIAIVGLQRGIPSNCGSSARVDYVPALCSYRLNDPIRCSDHSDVGGLLPTTSREVHRTLSFRGRRSRNKISVGEPAEGILSKPAKQNDPRTRFKHLGETRSRRGPSRPEQRAEGRVLLFKHKPVSAMDILALTSMKNILICDTWCELYNPVNHRVFERKLRPKPLGRGYVCLGVTHRVTSRTPQGMARVGSCPPGLPERAAGLNVSPH
uniref:rRNA intron-encoded homing endonuclease n=1 Tax=Solanum tuberosum TaxID=4113 RepID=M1BN45_SOLTU